MTRDKKTWGILYHNYHDHNNQYEWHKADFECDLSSGNLWLYMQSGHRGLKSLARIVGNISTLSVDLKGKRTFGNLKTINIWLWLSPTVPDAPVVSACSSYYSHSTGRLSAIAIIFWISELVRLYNISVDLILWCSWACLARSNDSKYTVTSFYHIICCTLESLPYWLGPLCTTDNNLRLILYTHTH